LNKSEIKRRFVKLFSIDILIKGAGFLLLPIYLNLMTQEEFGNYSYIFSIVGMLGFVFGMGQHATLNRFYHSSEYNRDTLIENLHLVLLSSFILFTFILTVFHNYFIKLFFKFSISNTLYLTMIFLAVLVALNQIFMSYLYQSENIKLVQKKNLFDFFTVNVIAISFLYFLPYPKDELRIFAITLASMISLMIFYKKFISKTHLKFANRSKVFYKRILFNGFPMAVGSFANFFISFGDRFVIEKLLDNNNGYEINVPFNLYDVEKYGVVWKTKKQFIDAIRSHIKNGDFLITINELVSVFSKYSNNANLLDTHTKNAIQKYYNDYQIVSRNKNLLKIYNEVL